MYAIMFWIHMKYIFLLPVGYLNLDEELVVCER